MRWQKGIIGKEVDERTVGVGTESGREQADCVRNGVVEGMKRLR